MADIADIMSDSDSDDSDDSGLPFDVEIEKCEKRLQLAKTSISSIATITTRTQCLFTY